MKTLATLAAAAVIVGAGTYAVAQPAPSAPDDAGRQRDAVTRSEIDALLDARIAAIQAGLRLNADQQRLFPPLEQAIRAISAERADRWERRDDERRDQSLGFVERFERQSERVSRRAENLRAFSTALRPFWDSLDEQQRRLLPVLLRPTAEVARLRMNDRNGDERRGRHGRGMMMHHD